MRILRVSFATPILLLTAAGPAGGALLSLLGTSTTEVRIGQLGGEQTLGPNLCPNPLTLPPLVFPMNTSGVFVSASAGGGFVEPAGIFTGTLRRTFPGLWTTSGGCVDTAFGNEPGFTIASLSNSTKAIAPGAVGGGHANGVLRPGGGLGGPGPLAGTFIVNVLFLFNLDIPLNAVGETGGVATAATHGIKVTLRGTGWTTGLVQVTGITTQTENGGWVNTVTFAGYDNRTPGHVGQIQLVSPFHVITNVAGNLPGLAIQALDFGVPEPGTLLLLGTGALGLVLYGRHRTRRE